jgi:membrane protein
MFRTFQIPLTWTDLARRTVKDIMADDVLGLAAQLSYYFLFALVPSILCLVALASFLPSNVLEGIMGPVSRFAPDAVLEILREQLSGASSTSSLFTFGLLIAIWSSSAAMVGITDALNRAYDIEEARPWWKVRVTAIALTLGAALFIILALALVMMGPALVERIAASIGLGPVFAATWSIARWPVAFVLTVLGIGLVYYFAPDAEQDWEWVTPGAVLATILWLIASLAFKLYVANLADYSGYGSLGGVMVLMLWFYLTALAVLAGAEMNAEIEHASPHGKDPGEKVPGEKKMIGARAARAYEERQRTGGVAERVPKRPSIAAYAVLGTGLLTTLFRKRSRGAPQ